MAKLPDKDAPVPSAGKKVLDHVIGRHADRELHQKRGGWCRMGERDLCPMCVTNSLDEMWRRDN